MQNVIITSKNAAGTGNSAGSGKLTMDPYYVGDPMPGDLDRVINPWITPRQNTSIGTLTGISTISYAPDPWRRKVEGESITLSYDVPGVRVEDANVEIDCGVIKFSGRRHDTGATVSSTCNVGHDYDPESATASIDMGVLTIKLERLASRRTHKVPVSAP